jgi:O-antigen ligase
MNFKKISVSITTLYLALAYLGFAFSNIVLIVAFIFYLWALFTKRIKVDMTKENLILFFIIIIPFFLTFISTINTKVFPINFNFVIDRLPILLVAFIYLNTLNKKEFLLSGISLFIIASIVAVVYTTYHLYYLNSFSLIKINTDLSEKAAPIQRIYLGYYLLLAIVFWIHLFKKRVKKQVYYFVIIILMYGVYLSASRMAYILLLLVMMLSVMYSYSVRKRIVISGLFIISFLVLIYYNDNVRDRFIKSLNPETSARMMIWNNAYKVYRYSDYPVFGISISDYYQKKTRGYWLKGNIEKAGNTYKGFYGYEPHNQYLDFILFNGILGVFFIIGIFYLGYVIINSKNLLAIMLYIIPVSVMLVESVFMRQWGVILYIVPLSIAATISKN